MILDFFEKIIYYYGHTIIRFGHLRYLWNLEN